MSISVITECYFDKIIYLRYNYVIMKKRVRKDKALVVYPITTESVKSIEEMAKLGMPFSILAKNQQTWLIKGGLEYFKEEKPYLYPLIEEMVENKDEAIPEELTSLAKKVVERLEGENLPTVLAWVERILRWKIEPYHLRSERILKVANILKEVIEEGYKEKPEEYKYLYKSISEWIKWNRRMMEYAKAEEEREIRKRRKKKD